MLEKPDLKDERIFACLQEEFGRPAAAVTFLPQGADFHTAVYAVHGADGVPYFLKLRSGPFDEVSVALPKFLNDLGMVQIIAPLITNTGQLWASLDEFKVTLYPYIDGRNGYEVGLTDRQWVELGAALKRLHTAVLPAGLIRAIRRETYSPKWRNTVRNCLKRIDQEVFREPVAAKMAAFLGQKKAEILDLVARAETLAGTLQLGSPDTNLCHADLHAGNLLIAGDGSFYLVDWDDPVLAPIERDLMFIGGGLMGAWRSPSKEESLFYQGYGPTNIDPSARAYFRYERIVQDIAVYCEQILFTEEGGDDRRQSLHYLKSNFLPGGTIEIAYRSDSIDWAKGA